MLKIVTVCGAGVGSSVMLRLYTQQVLESEGIEATVDASDIGSLDPNQYDLIVTTSTFVSNIRSNEDHIVKVDNMMDKEALKTNLLEAISKI